MIKDFLAFVTILCFILVNFHPAPMDTCTCTGMLQKQIVKFIFSKYVERTTICAHRMKESLSLPKFKRKQLRHELYPSQPHPPLGTSFLPLSRTDTFLSRLKTHLFRAPFSPPQLPPHQLFLSLSLSYVHPLFSALVCPLVLYPVCTVRRHKKKKKKYTHATRIYWDCSLSVGFLFLSGFLSLSAHGTQTDFLVDASREQIPLKRCLIIIFCVHFCSVNIRKHVFHIYLQDLVSC